MPLEMQLKMGLTLDAYFYQQIYDRKICFKNTRHDEGLKKILKKDP